MSLLTNLLLLCYGLIGCGFAAWTFWGFVSSCWIEAVIEFFLAIVVAVLWPAVALLLLSFSIERRIRKWRRMSR